MVEALERAGSTHHRLAIGAKSLATPFRAFALRRLLRALKPDIVHARSRLPAWVTRAALIGLSPRPAFITTVHGLNSSGAYSGVMASGDAVICVSTTVRDYVLAHWPQAAARLQVIARGVDAAQFPRQPRPDALARTAVLGELGLPPETRLLLMPGRGTRLKGHAEAIALLGDLHAEGISAALWMLGTDEPGREAYLAELRTLAESLGVAARLRISPPRSDVVRAYAAADLVLQLSRQPEAFGRTVVEALSVGAPVLGWAYGGVGEQLAALQPEGAVTPGDATALRAAARRLLDMPPAMPASIPYTLDAMQRATLELYARHAG